MNLSPNTMTVIAVVLLGVIFFWHRDDPRAGNWVKAQWSATVGAWFAKRRRVSSFGSKPFTRIRIDEPSQQCRRDINTGSWT